MLSFVGLLVAGSWLLSIIKADTQCPYINTTTNTNAWSKSSVRIMQFNAEWLFVDYYAPFGCPGDACPWKNESQARTHLDTVANIIRSVDPDIINICEVEGCDELQMLSDNLQSYSSYLIQGTDSSTGQNVGLLSRIQPAADLRRVETRVEYPIPGSSCGYTGAAGSSAVSKHYITEYRFPNQSLSLSNQSLSLSNQSLSLSNQSLSLSNQSLSIALISAHLIAYPDDPARCVQREAQAQVLQQVIAGYVDREYEIILLGDFNDFDGEVPDINGNIPISRVLSILKGHFGQFSGKYNLTSAATKVNQTSRYSDWYEDGGAEYSEIDFILVSPKIYERITRVEFVHTYDKATDYYAPDHFPVIIDISLE